MKILTQANTKILKSREKGYLTTGVHFLPDKELCPYATKLCLMDCLVSSGMGRFNNVKKSRKAKSQYFKTDLIRFYPQLIKEIQAFEKKAKKLDLIPAVRLNLTSDINWGELQKGKQITPIFNMFPAIQFYDYTKDFAKICGNGFKNYHLTFSFSGENIRECEYILIKLKKNVAMVFSDLPEYYSIGNKEYSVINGDNHDLRFLDFSPAIIGIKAKGTAKNKENDFIINPFK